jgi:hypothetical protein
VSVDLTSAAFKKSRLSGDNGCVEVATNLAEIVAVRDSKDLAGPVLVFSQAEWTAFVGGVRDGEFDL